MKTRLDQPNGRPRDEPQHRVASQGRPPPLRGCGTRRRRGVHVDGVVVRISACRGAHVSSVAYVNLPDSRTAKVPCRRGWRRGAGGRKRWRTGAAISSTGAGRGGVEALAQGAGRPCARRAGAPRVCRGVRPPPREGPMAAHPLSRHEPKDEKHYSDLLVGRNLYWTVLPVRLQVRIDRAF